MAKGEGVARRSVLIVGGSILGSAGETHVFATVVERKGISSPTA